MRLAQKSNTFSPLSLYVRTLLVGVLVVCVALASQLPTTLAQTSSSLRFTATLKFQEVAPGIEHGRVSTGQPSKDDSTGPWLINILRIDLKRAELRIVRALDQGVGLETVSSLSARYRALAAINGGYFRTSGTYRGESAGLFLLDRKLISESNNDRAAVGLILDRNATDVIFGHLKYHGEISLGRAKHLVQGLNRPVGSDELIVFTPEFHRTTLTNPDGIEVVVRRNRIVSINDLTGSSQIPPDGFVLSARGTSRDWVKRNVRRGLPARFDWRITSKEPDRDIHWGRAHSIVAGAPQLIKSGKISITDVQEKILPTFAPDRHPRTAIGRRSTGEMLLVTVDGRQPGVSVGMSLYTLADLLIELGAVDAINLDGGGSTTMVVRQQIVNKPSDQTGERPVSDAILVFSKGK